MWLGGREGKGGAGRRKEREKISHEAEREKKKLPILLTTIWDLLGAEVRKDRASRLLDEDSHKRETKRPSSTRLPPSLLRRVPLFRLLLVPSSSTGEIII